MKIMRQIKHFLFGNLNEKAFFEEIKKDFTCNGQLIPVSKLLHVAYEKYSSNPVLIGPERTLSYEEFYFRVLLLSKKLYTQGIRSGDKVILFYENSIDFCIIYFAIWQLGAVVTPLNIFLHERELAYIIEDAQPLIIFTSMTLKSRIDSLYKNKLLAKIPVILTGQSIDWRAPSVSYRASIKEELKDAYGASQKIDEMCVLLYTSGTTGKPKGVMLSSKNVVTNVMQAFARFKMFKNLGFERFFCVLPLFHAFAQNVCLWLPVMTGSSVIIVKKICRKLIREGLEKKPTMFFGFPALYGLLCLMKTAPLESIKVFVSGADMMPDRIRSAFAMIYGRKICSGYGLTEASPVVSVNYNDQEQATNVVGKPFIGISYSIRDDQGGDVKQGHVGTLWIKGDNVMLGYYKVPKEQQTKIKDGWLNTGDLAVVNEHGMLAITGRSKDLIIHKGFNIYPQEVENILLKHPLVFKAAVVGRSEVVSGQIPIAYLAVKDKNVDLQKSLRTFCLGSLAAYKVPRKFICLEDLPMNSAGKIDKKKLLNLQ